MTLATMTKLSWNGPTWGTMLPTASPRATLKPLAGCRCGVKGIDLAGLSGDLGSGSTRGRLEVDSVRVHLGSIGGLFGIDVESSEIGVDWGRPNVEPGLTCSCPGRPRGPHGSASGGSRRTCVGYA